MDLSTGGVLLEVDNPSANHNGGQVLFGPDGFLYITTGDGGGANDASLGHNGTVGNAQDPYSTHGKVLRVDVDGGDPYSVPDDKPYAGGSGLPQINALGLRNPAYATFDPIKFASFPLPFGTPGSPSEPWNRDGLSPYASYFAQNGDYVNLSSGLMSFFHTDLSASSLGEMAGPFDRQFVEWGADQRR